MCGYYKSFSHSLIIQLTFEKEVRQPFCTLTCLYHRSNLGSTTQAAQTIWASIQTTSRLSSKVSFSSPGSLKPCNSWSKQPEKYGSSLHIAGGCRHSAMNLRLCASLFATKAGTDQSRLVRFCNMSCKKISTSNSAECSFAQSEISHLIEC